MEKWMHVSRLRLWHVAIFCAALFMAGMFSLSISAELGPVRLERLDTRAALNPGRDPRSVLGWIAPPIKYSSESSHRHLQTKSDS